MEMTFRQRSISLGFSNQGFTIIELLVAMVISLLALGAIYSTFLGQQRSYVMQQETAAMQQNLRAAMFYMQREIRMAGCDPLKTGNFGITAANTNSITFTEDIRGSSVGNPPDGNLQAAENITYSLSGGNLVRNVGGGNQVVSQNVDALNFVYLDSDGNPTTTLADIRSVEITIVERTGRALLASKNNVIYRNQRGTTILGPMNDNFSRRRLTAFIRCRNLGL